MKTIWKITLKQDTHVTEIQLPEGCRALSVHNQFESLVMYLEVNTEKKLVDKKFMVIETGKEIINHDESSFIGSALFLSGTYVCHVYELI